jgi:putative transposase
VGDINEISTPSANLYPATVDLHSLRRLGAASATHPDTKLAFAAFRVAVAAFGGEDAMWRNEEGQQVIFHTDRGST